MPRSLRIDLPDLIYHVTNRGVKQLPIFLEDNDRWDFIRLLRQTLDAFPARILSYCLMTNHYHLLLQPIRDPLSKIMQYFNSLYASRFNRKHRHVGHLFQGRYHSIPVEQDAYLTTVSRYIHLNPVRARIVHRPDEYIWSNYRSMIRGEPDPLADPAFVLGYFGQEIARQRQGYQRFVEDLLDKPEPITDRALSRMRFWGRPPALMASKHT